MIGPDEYHEPVDDNAFKISWRAGIFGVPHRSPVPVTSTKTSDKLGRLADALLDGYDPVTGLYEQFAGFYGLSRS